MAPESRSHQSPDRPAANVRPGRFLPTAHETLWDQVAAVLPGCKDRPSRARARRQAHPGEVIALRMGLRRDPKALGSYLDDMRRALEEPLESPRPLTEVVSVTLTQCQEGGIALVQLLDGVTAEELRRFIREGQEAIAALSAAVAQARLRLEETPCPR
jgi:uncharacterized NAD(P)/FAD-binding protein YdhS